MSLNINKTTTPISALNFTTPTVNAHPYYYQTRADDDIGQQKYYGDWYSFENGRNSFTPNNWNANNTSTDSRTYEGEYPQNANYRYFGYQGGDRYATLFSDKSIKWMQSMITKFLTGVHPEGKQIVVPEDTIRSVADSVFQTSFANADQMQKQVVSFIVAQIKEEYDTIQKNNNLNIWVTKYDIDSGMKQFDDVKLNNKQRSHYSYIKY